MEKEQLIQLVIKAKAGDQTAMDGLFTACYNDIYYFALKTLKEQNSCCEILEAARKYITQVGFNAHYGARPILGIIRKEIRRPLSKFIISGDIQPGDTVIMKYDEEKKEIQWEISDDSE